MCNLIAMVDIMFLLLLFFMLGADMGQRELAELVLPKADQVKPDPEKKDKTNVYTTINVHHRYPEAGFHCAVNEGGGICRDSDHWRYAIRGREYTAADIKPRLDEEAAEAMETEIDPKAGVLLSRRFVLIRADLAAPFGDVNRLIELCGQSKLYKIEVAAAQPPPSEMGK
jgi:biopolymer transport protein ExbD